MPSSLKRNVPNDFDDVDTENIDPLTFSSPSKKSRSFDFDLSKTAKAPLFTLTTTKTPAQYVQRAQAAGQKRKVDDFAMTPDSAVQPSKRAQPSSAPAPAGRSPKSKKAGILSRRRMTAGPFTRINPPAFSTGESHTGVPFSIDAALAGTMPGYKSKAKSKSTHRKSWQFEIHEDTPQDEMTNLMEHSACTLDISDDESRATAKGDKDNKENIPPIDSSASVALSSHVITSRRDMMTDDSRNPLGDLDAKDFYAQDCDESSVFIVGADDATETATEKSLSTHCATAMCPSTRPRANAVTDARDGWKEIISKLAPSTSVANTKIQPSLLAEDAQADAAAIEIWESESAKADNDGDDSEPVIGDISGQS